MSVFIHLALTPEAYRDADRLKKVLDELQVAGAFDELDARYAGRAGIVQGSLPQERLADVQALPFVESLSQEGIMRAL